MEGKKFSTPLADFHIKNGIVYGTFFGMSPTLEQAQQHVKILLGELKDNAPFLAITNVSAEIYQQRSSRMFGRQRNG